MARLLYRLGTFAHRRRWTVVLTWLLILVLGGIGAVTLGGQTSNTFSIPGQESTIALDKISEEFGAGDGNASARVVIQAAALSGSSSRSALSSASWVSCPASPAPAIR